MLNAVVTDEQKVQSIYFMVTVRPTSGFWGKPTQVCPFQCKARIQASPKLPVSSGVAFLTAILD